VNIGRLKQANPAAQLLPGAKLRRFFAARFVRKCPLLCHCTGHEAALLNLLDYLSLSAEQGDKTNIT